MSTVRRIKHIDLIRATKTATDNAVLAVAKVGAGKAKALTPVITGNLRSSITEEMVSHGKARYGTNVEYAIYVEYGTKNHDPQPFLRMSADMLKGQASKIFARFLKRGLRNG